MISAEVIATFSIKSNKIWLPSISNAYKAPEKSDSKAVIQL